MSNVTGVTDELNRTTNYTYDDFDRLTKIKYPEATVGAGRLEENFSYDLAGNLLTQTDPAGHVTTFCYDNANRLTSTIDAAQKTTTQEYNARSQLTAVVDAISQRYEFVYDPLGRVTQEKKGTATKSFTYDAAGNRSQRTDYNGAVTNYTYDGVNRLTAINYPDTTSATYGYDVLSRLTTATNPNGTVTLGYDNRGRVNSVTDVFGQVVTYAYDANSNRTQVSVNGATNATYQYDVINRLTQLTDNGALNTTFAYDANNKLTSRTLPNGVVSTYDYDGLNRLTRLKHIKGLNTLSDFQYQFNAVNDITQTIDGAGTHTYTYDVLDRLTAATHPNQANESYAYDDVGNRTASHQGSSYSYQPFNRLTAANGTSFGYDANGNQTSRTDASGSWTFAWDFEDRLKNASLAGGVSVNYSYDALGRRIERSAGTTARFVFDGPDIVRDLDNTNATVADYLNGPGVDNKLRQTASGTASYFLTDHLGTTNSLADSSGNVGSSLAYDSYGNVTGGSAATRYSFTGREADPDTGMLYFRARSYDPQQGRFVSEDPLGLSAGINTYRYVSNNPQNRTDSFGLYESDVHYWLTYFLAKKMGCFTEAEARKIAYYTQEVDLDPATSPGPGWHPILPGPLGYLSWASPDQRQMDVNSNYHALHPGSHQPYLDRLWPQGSDFNPQQLGYYLHYLQDTFSHDGYTNPMYGHGLDLHHPDKTASDVEKAVRMAQEVWRALKRYAQQLKRCNCKEWDDASWDQVRKFAQASGGPDTREINDRELAIKKHILGLD